MAAESNLKNVSLELGGKSPAIIFEDADLDAAARYTHFAINHNSGQHCQANSRVLIHESIAEEYIKKMKVLISKFAWGILLIRQLSKGLRLIRSSWRILRDLLLLEKRMEP